jgi:hypothetical protein
VRLDEARAVLTERRNWLTERIKAKEAVRWDTVWDQRERDALSRALEHLSDVAS